MRSLLVSLLFAIIALVVANDTSNECVQNCVMNGIFSVGATSGCQGTDYVSQTVCYCQTPGLGDSYSECLKRCPDGNDFNRGQEFRDNLCASVNNDGNNDKHHQHNEIDNHQQDQTQDNGSYNHGSKLPNTDVADIINNTIPQSKGNLGDYNNVVDNNNEDDKNKNNNNHDDKTKLNDDSQNNKHSSNSQSTQLTTATKSSSLLPSPSNSPDEDDDSSSTSFELSPILILLVTVIGLTMI